MSFNKDKALSAAEKLVAKGKIDAAIKEFQKILAKTGEDSGLLNKLGDLFVRLRKTDQAVKYWEKAAEKLEHDGFYPRAIAIQKKAQRANPGSLSVHMRLAELNRKLGLVNEARSHFQHLVDHYLRSGDAASAIGVFQKLIELEPDNLTHRAKLADLYRQQQLTVKAVTEYASIAAVMITHGEFEQALQVDLRALDLDPNDTEFVRRAVGALVDAGAPAEARQLFNAALGRNPAVESMRSLLHESGPAAEPGPVESAVDAGDSGDYLSLDTAQPAASLEPPPFQETGFEQISQSDGYESLADSGSDSAMEIEASELPDPVVSDFSSFEIITPEDDALDELELQPSGMAGAELQDGGFDLEIEIDEEEPATLVKPPPDMLGPDTPGQPVTPGSAFQSEEEIEITLEDSLLVDVQPAREVPAGLQETGPSPAQGVDLDFSFATEPELAAEAAAAETADDSIYLEIEDSGSAELVDSGAAAVPGMVADSGASPLVEEEDFEIEFPIEGVPAPGAAPPPPAPPAEALAPPPPLPPPPPPEPFALDPAALEAPAEPPPHGQEMLTEPPVEFDAAQRVRDLLAEAEVFVKYGLQEKAVDRLEEVLGLDPSHLGAVTQLLRLLLERGDHARVVPLVNQLYAEVLESGAMELWEELKATLLGAGFGFDGETIATLPGEAPPAFAEPEPEAAFESAAGESGGFVDLAVMGSEIDQELRDEGGPTPEAPTAELLEGEAVPVASVGTSWLDEAPAEAAAAPREQLFEEEEKLFDLAAELQGEFEPPEQAVPIAPEEQSLEEIVEGFKKGVAENLSPEDSDTHYNLGIAYREMLLLDEAISEFQIAAKNPDYLVNCCAMLGLCFREKGLPDLALKWYRRALESERIDEGQTLGMLYEIGNVYLETDDRQAAYDTFVEIYGMNTNYRDVAVKMQELGAS